MANSIKAPSISSYGSQNGANFYTSSFENPQILRSLSSEHVRQMKYKIELDKQVTEKQQRLAHEWENKIEREKKYVQHQPFGRHNQTTILNRQELEEILSKGRAPSPNLEMPPQYAVHHQPQTTETYIPNDATSSKMNGSLRQSLRDSHSQYPTYSSVQPQLSNNNNNANTNFDFQHFYMPNNNSNPNGSVTNAPQSLRGDAHDPFSSYDPNKEGQNAFNSIPQQDLYDPWGRPGAGAPLIHATTGQKFTRYSGSLQDKLNRTGPLGFHQNQYIQNIEDQKRDLELEQKRRQQEEMELRSNAGDTAEWITQLNKTNSPPKLYLPTPETTREKLAGAGPRYRSEENRVLHDDLVRQADERARLHKMSRQENSLAELQHTQAMNNWWGRSGSGAQSLVNRRQNVQNSFENSRRKWGTNHLGQLVLTDDEQQNPVRIQTADLFYPKNKQFSSHRNYYQLADDQTS